MRGVRLLRHPRYWPVVQRVGRRTLDAKVRLEETLTIGCSVSGLTDRFRRPSGVS